jgi:hypothetical protein
LYRSVVKLAEPSPAVWTSLGVGSDRLLAACTLRHSFSQAQSIMTGAQLIEISEGIQGS